MNEARPKCPESHWVECPGCGTTLIDPAESDDAEVAALRAALERAADTFEDIRKTMTMLGRPVTATAAAIAESDARVALARPAGEQP